MKEFAGIPEEQKQELIEKAYQLAYEYEQKYGNCPQCTVAAIQDTFGILDDNVFKAVYGLAAGIGLSSKGNCGGLIAAILVVSSLQGRDRQNFQAGRYPECYALSRKMAQKFEQKYGSILCHGIQKKIFGESFDLSDPQQFAAFEEAGGHQDKCPEVVGNAARWIAEMIVNGEI